MSSVTLDTNVTIKRGKTLQKEYQVGDSLFLLELDLDVAARRVSERLLCVLVEVVVLQPVATGG